MLAGFCLLRVCRWNKLHLRKPIENESQLDSDYDEETSNKRREFKLN